MNAERPSQRGFTLVELITVIAVLGLTMAVVAPRFISMTAFRARGYADEVAGALRYARRIAVATGCNVRFTLTATAYSAMQRSSKGNCISGGTWNREVLLPDGDELAGTTPSGVTVSAATIEFDNTGKPLGAVPAISVSGYSIAVDPAIGRVAIQ